MEIKHIFCRKNNTKYLKMSDLGETDYYQDFKEDYLSETDNILELENEINSEPKEDPVQSKDDCSSEKENITEEEINIKSKGDLVETKEESTNIVPEETEYEKADKVSFFEIFNFM